MDDPQSRMKEALGRAITQAAPRAALAAINPASEDQIAQMIAVLAGIQNSEVDLLRRLGVTTDIESDDRERLLQLWAAARDRGICDAEFWAMTPRELLAILEHEAHRRAPIPTVPATTPEPSTRPARIPGDPELIAKLERHVGAAKAGRVQGFKSKAAFYNHLGIDKSDYYRFERGEKLRATGHGPLIRDKIMALPE